MRTSEKTALSVAGLALLGIGGSAALVQMKRMPLMMQKCMDMCSEMLNAIRQITAMAAFAAPELEHAFGEWLKGLEDKALAVLAKGEQDTATLAAALNVGEDSARYILAHLAATGKATLSARARG